MPLKILKADIATKHRTALLSIIEKEDISVNKWCKDAGISEGTLRNFLSGVNNSMGIDKIELLAASINKTVAELIGDTLPIVMVPILGYVGAGEAVTCFDDCEKGAGLDEIELPPGMPADMVALIVRGDSMEPTYEADSVIFYQRNTDGVPPDCIGRNCVVKLANDGMLLKKVRQGSKPNLFHLISKNPLHPPMVDQRLQWASRVLYIKPR